MLRHNVTSDSTIATNNATTAMVSSTAICAKDLAKALTAPIKVRVKVLTNAIIVTKDMPEDTDRT